MPNPSARDWQDDYYDGVDICSPEEYAINNVWYVDDETWEWLLAFLDEEPADDGE